MTSATGARLAPHRGPGRHSNDRDYFRPAYRGGRVSVVVLGARVETLTDARAGAELEQTGRP